MRIFLSLGTHDRALFERKRAPSEERRLDTSRLSCIMTLFKYDPSSLSLAKGPLLPLFRAHTDLIQPFSSLGDPRLLGVALCFANKDLDLAVADGVVELVLMEAS
jgi:hypothetical protein